MTIHDTGTRRDLGSSAGQPAAEEQAVQRVRAVLLLRFTLVPGRNMYTVREAEVKNVFHGISSSIEGMSLAMYMAEMAAEPLSPTGQESWELRLLSCFYMMGETKRICG